MTSQYAPIFDKCERTDPVPSTHSESKFAFLNRIAGEYWEHPRQLMQTFADHISDPMDYNELRQRFRSHSDEQFRSAFLELYLHECLIQAGYCVKIHPPTPIGKRRPDFYAERDGQGFYLEAISPGTSPDTKAAAGRRGTLLDTVNRLGDPNFMLWLSELSEGPQPAPAKRLRNHLQGWLRTLDPDQITDVATAPEYQWKCEGWVATFKAVPLRQEARGRSSSPAIGVYANQEASFIDHAPNIRKALFEKQNAYGDLGTPFIIAVGIYIWDKDRWHSTAAIYGKAAVQFGETTAGETVTRLVRQPDGYFGTPENWQHRNVSGVILFNQLEPYRFHQEDATLWRHPDPQYPLPVGIQLPANSLEFGEGCLVETAATVTSARLFGLSDPWPTGEPWPHY